MPYRTAAFEEPDRLFEVEISVDYDVPLADAHRAAFGGLALSWGEFVPAAFQPVLGGRHDRVTIAVLTPSIVRRPGYRPAQLHELMAFHSAFPGVVDEGCFLAAFGSVFQYPASRYQRFPMIVAAAGLRYVSSEFYHDGFPYLANYYPLATWRSVVVR